MLAEVVLFGQKWFHLGKIVVFGKFLHFGQKWFYLRISGSVWAKVFLIEQNGSIVAKVVLFG